MRARFISIVLNILGGRQPFENLSHRITSLHQKIVDSHSSLHMNDRGSQTALKLILGYIKYCFSIILVATFAPSP